MYGLWQKIAGCSRCRILGGDAGRLVMLCKHRRLYLWDICSCDGGVEAFVLTPYIRELSETALVCGGTVTIIDSCGLPVIVKKAAAHKWFFIGFLLAVSIVYVLSRYIWAVEVRGNSFYTDEMLSAYLEEISAGAGSLKGSIVPSEVEEKIRLKYPRISWVSAQITGTKILLDIEEGQPETTEKDNDVQDICATYTGTVVSIVTRSGTPLVKKGDTVQKGDLLVRAGVDITGDDGTLIRTVETDADADIILRVKFYVDRYYDRHYTQKKSEGKTKKSYAVHFFGKTLILPDPFGKDLDDYEETKIYKAFRLTKDFYLPLGVTVTSRQPYSKIPSVYTDEEIKTIASEDLDRKIREMTESGVRLVENNTDFEITDDALKMTGHVVMEVPC